MRRARVGVSSVGKFVGGDTADFIEGTEEDDLIRGRGGDDYIAGLGGDDEIYGGAGDDEIYGGEGHDTIDGGADDDWIDSGAGDDIVLGGDGDDVIGTLEGDDVIEGGAGDDRIDDGFGNDHVDGGAGYDILYASGSYGVTVNLQDGTSLGQGIDTIVSIEGVSGSWYDDTLIGDDQGNLFYGGTHGSDTFIAHGGDDFFIVAEGYQEFDGGEGSDTLSVKEVFKYQEPLTTGAVIDLAEAEATEGNYWYAWGNYLDITSVENIEGSTVNDVLKGTADDNILAGREGNDVLRGREGSDTLVGDGKLLFNIDQQTTQIDYAEQESDGDDTLAGGGGNDFLYGMGGDDVLDGGAGHDNLFGGSGDDLLEGGEGYDNIDGGLGNDTASYADATSGVAVYLYSGAVGGAAAGDTITSIENLIGSDHDDNLRGDAQVNIIAAGAGDDWIWGGGNADQLYGEAGNDLFYIIGDGVLVDGGEGLDVAHFGFTNMIAGAEVDLRETVQSVTYGTEIGTQHFVSIEGVVGSSMADTLIGDGGDNLLFGWHDDEGVEGENDDVIKGYGGDDRIMIGEGNHALYGHSGTDTLEFVYLWDSPVGTPGITFSLALQSGAQDSGRGMVHAEGFENLSGSQHDDVLSGDAGDNEIGGSGGDDVLYGGEGNDVLHGDDRVGPAQDVWVETIVIGEAGADRLFGEGGDDWLGGGGGDDLLVGGLGYDTLEGGTGDDVLKGGARADRLDGGEGGDTLLGGRGNDVIAGGRGHDRIEGHDGADVISGGKGDDDLRGHRGRDQIEGGEGNDTMSGGEGEDVFLFGAGSGDDVILDFEQGDTIAFDSTLGLDFEDLDFLDAASGVFISWDGGRVLLEGVTQAAIEESDFDFGANTVQTASIASALASLAPLEEPTFALDSDTGSDALILDMIGLA